MIVIRAIRVCALAACVTFIGTAQAAWDDAPVNIQPHIQLRPGASARRDVDIRVDSNLVLIPVSVTDRGNHPVTGLTSDRFRIFEGKTEQKVLRLSRDDAPVSVGIVFDASASMARKAVKAREAVAEFLKTANPDDEFFLVTFSSTTQLAVPFTNRADEIETRLRNVDCVGKTALLDAVYLALNTMKGARNPRKALLVISDGGDNHSRYTENETRKMVREAGAWIYAIGVFDPGTKMLPEEERGGEKLLTDVAEETGGRELAVYNAGELPDAAAQIGLQLRNEYVLSYSPAHPQADGKYRRVQVRLVQGRGMNVHWRSGYYAPGR